MNTSLKGIELSISKQVIIRNLIWMIPITAVMCIVYLSLNQRIGLQGYENYLFPFEAKIPFIPQSAILYWLVLLLVFLIALLIKERQHFISVMTVNALSFCMNAVIWWIFPVGYPRPVSSEVSTGFYSQLIDIDSPLNSFPSGHITLLCLLFWVAWHYQKPMKYLLLIVAILGVFTVFTTKQHSVFDAVAGCLTMIAALSITKCTGCYKPTT